MGSGFRATFLQISFYWCLLQFTHPELHLNQWREGEGGGTLLHSSWKSSSEPALFGKMLQYMLVRNNLFLLAVI